MGVPIEHTQMMQGVSSVKEWNTKHRFEYIHWKKSEGPNLWPESPHLKQHLHIKGLRLV